MGVITGEELLASAAVAAVISGIVSLLVARSMARTERAKASDERARQARLALRSAVEEWHVASLEDAEWFVRQQSAGKVRGAMIEVAVLVGPQVRTVHFDTLLELLAAQTEDDLRRAKETWPEVQRGIVSALARFDRLA